MQFHPRLLHDFDPQSACVPYRQILHGFETRCICNVLRVTGGNVAKAARIMDISATSLRYKMKQFGISEKDY